MPEPAVDGSAVEEHSQEGGEVRPPGTQIIPVGTERASLTVAPSVEAEELGKRLQVIKSAMQNEMVENVDYGKIPGTDKPALLKPGAEKLGVLFQLDVQIDTTKHWGPGDHLTCESHAVVTHIPSGLEVGDGEGMCSTREKKYAKRRQDRTCPNCGKSAIKKSKFPPRDNPEAKPGWYCFAKIGGCGTNFAADDEAITGQAEGEIDNPELPDTYNTVVKMARKRARVDAILNVTAASALFTQDIDEDAPPPPGDAEPAMTDLQQRIVAEAPSDDVASAHKALALLFDTGKGPDLELASLTLARLSDSERGWGYFPFAVIHALRVTGGMLANRLKALKDQQAAAADAQAQAALQGQSAEPPGSGPHPGVTDAEIVNE